MSDKAELSAVQRWILQAQREILSRDKAHKDAWCRPDVPTTEEEQPPTPASNPAA